MDRRGPTKVVVAVLLFVFSLWGQAGHSNLSPVTPVTGESWLNHLHRSFDETSMGKTGRLGPRDEENQDGVIDLMRVDERQTITARGADLYRWNCRGCHGESGLGAPPEINSVINPVRSSSATLVMERMKKVGMDMSPAEARKLAKQSQEALLDRLHHGGQDMPAFPQLSDAEIPSLIAYLRELAEVPHAEQITISETPERVGEQIVKSTCHVCHSASGPNPGPWQLAQGTIPPLSTLTSRVNKMRFIQKVTRGAPIVMGNPAIMCRGRMPVLDYLNDEEVAEAYLYLTRYPLYQFPVRRPSVETAEAATTIPQPEDPQTVIKSSLVQQGPPKQVGEGSDMQLLALVTVVGVLVSILIGGALAFSIWECMRISGAKGEREGRFEVHPVETAAVKELPDRLSA